MTKITLATLASLQSEQTAIEQLNSNFAIISTVVEEFISRDGTAPNEMEADLDMNSYRILNLPSPVSGGDPVRYVDLQSAAVSGLVLPSITGQAGKYLSNDGTILTWQASAGGALLSSNNLSDVASVTTARTNLGLGTASQANVGASGDAVPKLNAINTWSSGQTFNAGITVTGLTLTGTTEGRISSTALTNISTDSIGYRGVPVAIKDLDYTMALNDSGWMLRHTAATAHAWTIPPNIYPIGTAIVLRNYGSGVVTVTRGAGVVLRIDSSSTDANRSIAQYGFGVLTQETTNVWILTGSGIS